ncbi:hypothetical protein K490DRAFT_32436 [Saccharata proteae CBS 121410]|uniref:Zn(2)-C6 fungal-type domain-containing protein n=1 Tax=Saccharata proteae CBS 121410 TaxID=1314787 RepID=A0A9P4I1S5_9PEZI|nr:hypothetical protein K490DRAFT_32436 [Saccharata proteae CBS 121410]
MAPTDDSHPADEPSGALPAAHVESSGPPKNPKLRKRTKTGCLTCRKRRIKCDEARPICRNCTKSKRHCEGYNQRVIFKSPLRNWPAAPGNLSDTLPFHSGVIPTPRPDFEEQQPISTETQHQSAFTGQNPPPQHSKESYYDENLQTNRQPGTAYDATTINFANRLSDGAQVPSQLPFTGQAQLRWSHGPSFQPLPQVAQETSNASHMTPFSSYSIRQQQNPQSQPLQQTRFPIALADNESANHRLLFPNTDIYQQADQDVLVPTELLQEAAVENEDDEYFDVDTSDDEMELIPTDSMSVPNGQRQGFEMMLKLYRDNINDLSVRSYNTMLYRGILDNYRPERTANPLKNPATARVFAHFIHATGPTLSIYERNPRNATAMFSTEAVHPSQQSLWTYTLPMMALNNQGLLHAMLAIASLHIAKLQSASQTPSLKHYAYALKKVRAAVDHSRRRHHPTTVAATLLLGFYEIMTADHVKWSSHLLGAKELFSELNFKEMTMAWRRQKTGEESAQRNFAFEHPAATINQRLFGKPYCPLPNEHTVGRLMGHVVRYDEFGKVEDGRSSGNQNKKSAGAVDIEHYEIYQDLWWWYSRHDAFQSVISGNRLLTDYSKWSDCPPRGPLGDPEALYGTHDHTVLLLGRIADFAARDRDRKIKAVNANGGQWRPGPGFPVAPPPTSYQQMTQQQGPGAHTHAKPRQSSSPEFYGMAPSSGRLQMPSHYERGSERHPTDSQTSHDETDLSQATTRAIDEWNDIRNALVSYASQLGSHFQPLPHDVMEQLLTPFGLSIQYRSYDIGIVWAMYYMMHIILIRCHPAMPPAAMVAAAVAAPQTKDIANLIGRICAGVVPLTHNLPLNPSLGAALIETSMPLFIAGIQYTDAQQRAWLVTRVKDIERRTGWASAGMIANGCQKVWEKAGQAGRGPPYVYPRDVGNPDERVAGRIEENGGYSQPPMDLTDRRFLRSNPITRVHWAFGLLSADEDVRPAPS